MRLDPTLRALRSPARAPITPSTSSTLHFGMPLDAKTRSVLGELLSHSDLTISRRASGGLIQALRQRRNRASQPQLPAKSAENP